ncbi:MAG: hypothetical protein ACP5G3_05990 [Sulfurihydrogenibium sp.]|uniref:hypothetical protein n=1 Tax=Sulfurihydrogenibium sp. TaxID=2053621 RepID=UPI003D0E8535
MNTLEVEIEKLIKDIEDNEIAMQKLVKYLNRLKKQIKRETFYKDLDRRMEKIINGKAEFISLKDVKKSLNL